MILVLGLQLNVATIILGYIFSMLLNDSRACGPISIPTPTIVALTVFPCRCHDKLPSIANIVVFHIFFTVMVSVFLDTLCLLWSIAKAVSNGCWPILYKVLTLNFAICIMLLSFNNFCLSSVADFLNTGTRAQTSAGRAFFYPRKDWSGLDMLFG